MNKKFFSSLLIVCMLLTGCSNIKNIQDLTYIVAIGMDYNKDTREYTAYLQGLNFINVAKQEGGRTVEPIPIFIASATSETLNLAVSKLYSKAEPPLFFGHVVTLILSQDLVENRFDEVIKEIGRNRSLRPTLRVMTTSEDIEKVLNIKALFNYPAVYTVLFKKSDTELFQDELKPVTLMSFLRKYNEPMGVAKLPSVKIDHDSWKADQSYPVLYFDGYALFQHEKFVKTLPFKDSVYVNWLLEKKVLLNQKVVDSGETAAVVKLASPKMKIKYDEGAKTPKVSIELAVRADLVERIKDISVDDLKRTLEKELTTKVKEIYIGGIANEADILNVGERWFREHPKEYRDLAAKQEFYLDKDSLKDVKVNVQILHFNSYKYNSTRNGFN